MLSCLEIAAKAYSKPRNIIYVATTYQQARDIAWNTLKKIVEPITLQINESRLEIKVQTIGNGSSLISLRGWENIDTLRGQKVDFAVLDEVASMRNFWESWQEIIRPTLTDTKGEVMFISTPKGYNHFFDLCNLELKNKDFKTFHFTSYDNPTLDATELDAAKKELTDDRFAQEYLADFRKTEGLVYKEFSREQHLFDDTTPIYDPVETIAGIDFGFTNPTAVISIVRDGQSNFWVKSEYYKSGQTEAQIAELVSTMKFNKVYPDPESPSAIKELRDRNVNVREVLKNKDSIINGIAKIRELLKANRLKIHKECFNLIMEFETYSYPDKEDMHNPKEVPIKENDHALDALRYAIYMQNDRPQTISQFIPSNLTREPQSSPNRRVNQFIPNFKR